ncbi:InlB B-repeat-containing protein, partial [bacterium]|nr:InlB B-repeat-containing protein [bacterium]
MNQEKTHRSDISGTISRFVFVTALIVAGIFSGQQLYAQPYSLTINIIGDGSVTRSPSTGNYAAGTVVDIEAIADAGWTFTSWDDDLSGSTNPTSVTMNSDITVTATFTQDTYTLTLNTSGNGTATKTPNTLTHLSGTNVGIEATPDLGWNFTGWSGNLTGTTNPATVVMDGNKLITANFTLNSYELTVGTDGTSGAAVSPSGAVSVGHGQAQVITVTSIPAGYQFNEWTVTSGTGASIFNKDMVTTTVTLTDGAATVEASFELKQYTLTVITDGTDGSAVSPATPVAVTHGQPETISVVTMPEGYRLTSWSIVSGFANIANNTLETTTATLTNGNAIIQANFELKEYRLTLLTDGTQGAAVSPALPVMVTHGQPRIISAVTPTGYKFKDWAIVSGTVTLGNETVAITTATLTSDDVILRANFELKKYTMSLITDGTPGATVSPALPVVVEHGQPQLISATTIPVGYKFKNWTLFSGSATFEDDTMAT